MLDRREQRREEAGDLLGRRVRGAQRRMTGLDLRQLAHELVVLGIGDRRRIQHVVAVGVLVQVTGQLRGARPHRWRDLAGLVLGVGSWLEHGARGAVRAGRGRTGTHAESSASARPASRQRRNATRA